MPNNSPSISDLNYPSAMKGKIFQESANSYQDQAKILFNYYQQAAEKIVAEEERIEKEIARLNSERSQLEKEIAGLWVWFLTIILFFVYFSII